MEKGTSRRQKLDLPDNLKNVEIPPAKDVLNILHNINFVYKHTSKNRARLSLRILKVCFPV